MNKSESECLIVESPTLEEVPIKASEYDILFDIQQEILSLMASHGKTSHTFNHLCSLAENLLPNSVATIMLLDKETQLLNLLTAPSVPPEGFKALANLKPGPGGGSCGNAVFHNEAQYVFNTFEDDRWCDLRQVAYDFNLCSCWSMPICGENNKPLGTFALSSFEHRSPAAFHKKLLEMGVSIVNLVLKNQANEERVKVFSKALQDASEAILITDKDNRIIEVNPAFERLYGYKEAEVVHQNPRILSAKKKTPDFYKNMWEELLRESQWSGELINKCANGTEIKQWTSVSRIYDSENETHNHLAIYTDLTEIKKAQEQAEYIAYHDSITNLYNKTYLEQLLINTNDSTLVILNINNFSYINTAYGFDFGDKLLIKVAKILGENFDAYSSHRLNSDEFVFFFDDVINVKIFIKSIQEFWYKKSIEIEQTILNISFTYGAAISRNANKLKTVDAKNNSTLLRNAALALKQAKELGKNRFHIFNEGEDSINHIQRKAFIAWNNLLHDALDHDHLVPFFQGIYNNKTGQIIRYEALVRIKKNEEIISPEHFLDQARLSGLLPEITKVMIDKTFQFMSKNSYIFSLNIAEDDLSRRYLIDYFDIKLKQYNINPERIILEILEGISTIGEKNHLKQLASLKTKGFSLAIDDFGAEYSNFERILELEIDYIKIDAKYIKDIDINPKSYEIARAIVFFAKNVNIPCIAEHVHSSSVQKIVNELGIEYSQGYYFSIPNSFP